jgi:hypothetical protein
MKMFLHEKKKLGRRPLFPVGRCEICHKPFQNRAGLRPHRPLAFETGLPNSDGFPAWIRSYLASFTALEFTSNHYHERTPCVSNFLRDVSS